MELTICKPEIYNGAGIYNTGAEGGGGQAGVIYEFDFLNYPGGALQNKVLTPVKGNCIFFNSLYCFLLKPDGLYNNDNYSGGKEFFNLFGFSGKKIKFSQSMKGISDGSNWGSIGIPTLGYANNYSSNRGMGIFCDSTQLSYGSFKNGCSAPWGLSDQTFYSGYGSLIIPETPLLPISQSHIENEAVFDFDSMGIAYKINGVDAFECSGLPDELFYSELQRAMMFGCSYGGIKLALESIKIECE